MFSKWFYCIWTWTAHPSQPNIITSSNTNTNTSNVSEEHEQPSSDHIQYIRAIEKRNRLRDKLKHVHR